MNKKCLIIFGSPRRDGEVGALVDEFQKNFDGGIDFVDAFGSFGAGVKSCLDCGGCFKSKFCVIKDDFAKLTQDDYDVLLIASPIFQSNLPGPMINVINRTNFLYGNSEGLRIKHNFKPKVAGLIIVGGGHGCASLQGTTNEDLAIKQSKYIFHKFNANLKDENIFLYLNSNAQSIKENPQAIKDVANMAQRLSR